MPVLCWSSSGVPDLTQLDAFNDVRWSTLAFTGVGGFLLWWCLKNHPHGIVLDPLNPVAESGATGCHTTEQ